MKFFNVAFLTALTVLGLSACSSLGDKVIARSDDLSSRPEWVKESETFVTEDGKVYLLGMATLKANARPEAGYRIAESNAKRDIAATIENQFNAVFQNAEYGTDLDSTQTKYIAGEATKLTASGIRPTARYWEKVVTLDDNGKEMVVYRVYARVSIDEQVLNDAIKAAIDRASGKGKLPEDFKKQVDAHWDQLVNAQP